MACVTDQMSARRKRLQWRATHRGIKEMDLLLGGYVEAHLAQMSADDLDQLEMIIDMPDQTLLAWATNQETMPDKVPPLLKAILAHRP